MADLNHPIRFREQQSDLGLPQPAKYDPMPNPSDLNAFGVTHSFLTPSGPAHVTDARQVRFSSTNQRREFSSVNKSYGIRNHSHQGPYHSFSSTQAGLHPQWTKSVSVAAIPPHPQTFVGSSLNKDTPHKLTIENHGTMGYHQCRHETGVHSGPVSAALPVNNAERQNDTAPMVNSTLPYNTHEDDLASTTSSTLKPVSSPKLQPDTKLPEDRVTPNCHPSALTDPHSTQTQLTHKPLPQWNMRLANLVRYPKYNTRKNSGFERRIKHTGLILDPKMTLRLLRKILQPFINRAVNNVLQHYMEEYISLAVRNIRDNLGESAVTEKDLMRFRRSIIHRVALQYFVKEEAERNGEKDQGPTGSSICGPPGHPTNVPRNDQCSDATTVRLLHPGVRVRSKKSHDVSRSLHRQIVENHWGSRLENGLQSSNGGVASPGLSPAASDGPDSLFGDVNIALHGEKTSLDESTTQSTSAVSSPATSDRLHLASLKIPAVILADNGSGSMRVSSRSTSPHTPSSVSSCSTVGYFFDNLSHSEDEGNDKRNDRLDVLHNIPPPQSLTVNPHASSNPADDDVIVRRRSKRAAKRTPSWWNWEPTRRTRPKYPRSERMPTRVSKSDKLEKTTADPNQSCNEGSQLKSTQNESQTRPDSSTGQKLQSADPISESRQSTNPCFTLNQDTVFTLGSSANTWLGMGAARGRIYTKHPELFRYPCDAQDKAWLVRNGLLASHGVKAYLMHSDQVKYIGLMTGRMQSSLRLNGSPSDDLPTFTVPQWLVNKVILMASSQRGSSVKPASESQPSLTRGPKPPVSVEHNASGANHFSTELIGDPKESVGLTSQALHRSRDEPPMKIQCTETEWRSSLTDLDDLALESHKTRSHRSDVRHQMEKSAHKDVTLGNTYKKSSPQMDKISQSCTSSDNKSAGMSPKSPPTLQRFDYL